MLDVQLDEGGQGAEEGRKRGGVVSHVCHPGREKRIQMAEDRMTSSLGVRRNVQYGVEASSLYDLLWETFFIPVQCQWFGSVRGLCEVSGIGSYVVGEKRNRRCYTVF